jgi:predicted transposase/invertase (TIGR01784 family)
VRTLLQSFVKLKWVELVDFDHITLEPVTFIDRDFKKKEADLIWKLPLKDGKTAYLYLLLEFQSTIDKSMPLRLLSYIVNFYSSKHKELKDGKLPVVFPLVLYNGKPRWTAPKCIEDMIERVDDSLRDYIIHQKHYLIDIGSFSAQGLRKLHRNLLGAMFLMEKARTGNELLKVFGEIVNVFKQEIDGDMIKLFSDWLEVVFSSESLDATKIKETFSNIEGNPMILETVDKLFEEREKRGREIGVKVGEKRGKIETAKEMLKEGMGIDLIKKMTKLSEEDIRELMT